METQTKTYPRKCWINALSQDIVANIVTYSTDNLSEIVGYSRIQRRWQFILTSSIIHSNTYYNCDKKIDWKQLPWKQNDDIPLKKNLFHSIQNLWLCNSENYLYSEHIMIMFPNLVALQIYNVNDHGANVRFPFQGLLYTLVPNTTCCDLNSKGICHYDTDCCFIPHPKLNDVVPKKIEFDAFHQWSKLRTLTIMNVQLSISETSTISKMPQLRILMLSNVTRVTCATIAELGLIANLEHLEFENVNWKCSEPSQEIHQKGVDTWLDKHKVLFPKLLVFHISQNLTTSKKYPKLDQKFFTVMQSSNLKLFTCTNIKCNVKCFHYPQLEILGLFTVISTKNATTNFPIIFKKSPNLKLILIQISKKDQNEETVLFWFKFFTTFLFKVISFDHLNYIVATKMEINNLYYQPFDFWESLFQRKKMYK
jgi:hypothetical protein